MENNPLRTFFFYKLKISLVQVFSVIKNTFKKYFFLTRWKLGIPECTSRPECTGFQKHKTVHYGRTHCNYFRMCHFLTHSVRECSIKNSRKKFLWHIPGKSLPWASWQTFFRNVSYKTIFRNLSCYTLSKCGLSHNCQKWNIRQRGQKE